MRMQPKGRHTRADQCDSISFYIADRKHGVSSIIFREGATPSKTWFLELPVDETKPQSTYFYHTLLSH